MASRNVAEFFVTDKHCDVSTMSDRGLFVGLTRPEPNDDPYLVRFNMDNKPIFADLWKYFDNRVLWFEGKAMVDMNAPLDEIENDLEARAWTPEHEHLRPALMEYKKARIVAALKKRAEETRAKLESDQKAIDDLME